MLLNAYEYFFPAERADCRADCREGVCVSPRLTKPSSSSSESHSFALCFAFALLSEDLFPEVFLWESHWSILSWAFGVLSLLDSNCDALTDSNCESWTSASSLGFLGLPAPPAKSYTACFSYFYNATDQRILAELHAAYTDGNKCNHPNETNCSQENEEMDELKLVKSVIGLLKDIKCTALRVKLMLSTAALSKCEVMLISVHHSCIKVQKLTKKTA